jgi:hypothetical protein
MNSQTCLTRAELEFAELRLRDVLVEEFRQDSKADAMSLDRILVHVVNMNEAISTSPESHDNVAKRLDDFAGMTSRMATRNPTSAAKLTRLSEALRAVSARIREKPSNVNVPRPEVAAVQIKAQRPVLEKLVHGAYDPLVAFGHSGRCVQHPVQRHTSTEAATQLRS